MGGHRPLRNSAARITKRLERFGQPAIIFLQWLATFLWTSALVAMIHNHAMLRGCRSPEPNEHLHPTCTPSATNACATNTCILTLRGSMCKLTPFGLPHYIQVSQFGRPCRNICNTVVLVLAIGCDTKQAEPDIIYNLAFFIVWYLGTLSCLINYSINQQHT